MREFCGLKWNSLSRPPITLLYGMFANEVPMEDPTSLLRHTEVRSMKPTGTRHVFPMRRNTGACAVSTGPSQGLPFAAGAGAAWGTGIAGIAARVAGAAVGKIGAMLATWPRLAGVIICDVF